MAAVAVPLYDHEGTATATTAATVRAELDAFLAQHEIDAAVRMRVRQCVAEAVNNVVRHAYPAGSGPVEVVADIERDLQVVVSDEGAGIRPADDAEGHGFGLVVVAEYTDDLTLRERLPRGVEVWMRFLL